MFGTMKELVEAAGSGTIADAAKREQAGGNIAEIPAQVERMGRALEVMRASSEEGAQPDLRSMSGLTGGGASKLFAHAGRAASGPVMGRAIARALAVAECNACMGKIVAAPTAGACGILPAALLTMQETRGYSDEELTDALFTAAAVGAVIAARASIAGAEGGCQAECGTASAMAALCTGRFMYISE